MNILNRTHVIPRPSGGYYIYHAPLVSPRKLPRKLALAPMQFVGLYRLKRLFHKGSFIAQVLGALRGTLRFICIDRSRASLTRHHDMASGLRTMYNCVEEDPENWMIDKYTGLPVRRVKEDSFE